MNTDDTSKLNVSLEPHLVETLKPLLDLLPTVLSAELGSYVSETPKDIIPYSNLLAISQWSRTSEGQEKLRTYTPPLDASAYTMVSLLAGVKTSPERKFGTYAPPPEPEQLAEQQKRERQEITTILNALLSIVGAGFATWWAADRLHWKDQWRVLLALAASLIVAIAEGGLFIILRSRQDALNSSSHRRPRVKATSARHKKIEDDVDGTTETHINVGSQSSKESGTNNLRQRRL
ncbi:hypothetical protein P691DRAFT_658222 [Macrolepiota fuliginosa MF-IS2]|uniref:Uncharacterized protein n=1 Tax=Macrolepiota fuliginosa MF-IS2 TaxID=1400762 RepID=A0A9P5XPS3_9AGAR|nr:hypothetical protein P691DRAFT_658222 [Macrolepiota fuliginosa MF-IS2]